MIQRSPSDALCAYRTPAHPDRCVSNEQPADRLFHEHSATSSTTFEEMRADKQQWATQAHEAYERDALRATQTRIHSFINAFASDAYAQQRKQSCKNKGDARPTGSNLTSNCSRISDASCKRSTLVSAVHERSAEVGKKDDEAHDESLRSPTLSSSESSSPRSPRPPPSASARDRAEEDLAPVQNSRRRNNGAKQFKLLVRDPSRSGLQSAAAGSRLRVRLLATRMIDAFLYLHVSMPGTNST